MSVLRSPALGDQRRLLGEAASPAARTPTAAPALAPGTPAGSTAPQFDAGYAEGLRQGLVDAQARLEREIDLRRQALQTQVEQAEKQRRDEHGQRIAALEHLLQTVQKALPDRFLALEREAIELAYEALCRVCGPHAEHNAGAGRAGLLADILRQGVHQLRGQPWLGVRLHPRDHAALVASDAGRVLLARHPELRVQMDPTLEPLAAVLESDHGQLDVSLGIQLARLKDVWARADRADVSDLGAA
jgi:flagellar biosynthesis/type III secretory pathway protein FliH